MFEKNKIFRYLITAKKKTVINWFIASIVFSSISIIVEFIIALFYFGEPFSYSVISTPAMEGKILLGALLMAAASLMYYDEKKEKQWETRVKTNDTEESNNDKEQLDFGAWVSVQRGIIVIVGIAYGILIAAVKVIPNSQTLKPLYIIPFSYFAFLLVAAMFLCFKFEFLWNEADFNDFRDWDTKTGPYMKKNKKPFNNIET